MKRELKKLLAMTLALLLALGCTIPALAAGTDGTVKKEETVYLILNEDGSVKEQIVSDWLHCDKGLRNVRDKSSLSDIENLKSDTQPIRQGEALTWDTEEKDIYYQGKSSAKPPISVNISYELEGKVISPEELSGKSGRFSIHVKLQNNETGTAQINGKQRTICTPFFTLCAAMLPAESFTNISAEHGRVQTDSKTQLACFLALPGVSDSLKGLIPDSLSQINDYLLDELIIETDMENGQAPTFLFAAAPSLEGLSDAFDEPELADQMEQLKEATEELQNGAGSLDEAVGTLVEKLGEFSSGYAQFDQGVESALSGSQTLAAGGQSLLENALLLNEKTGELSAGAQQLQAGAGQLADQLNTQLVPALTAAQGQKDVLQNKMASLSGQLSGLTIPDVSGLKGQLSSGVGKVFDGAAYGAAQAASSATGQVIYEQMSGTLAGLPDTIAAQSGTIVSTVQGADLQVVQQVLANSGLDENTQAALLTAIQNSVGGTTEQLTAGVSQGLTDALPTGLLSGNPITEEAAGQIASAVCGSEQMQAARSQAVSAVASQVPNIDTAEFNTLLGEFQTLSGDASAMLSQVDALTAALYDPENPGDQGTVVGAANALAAGAESLSGGASALSGGVNAFASGVGQLAEGTNALYSGLGTLSSSSKTVADSISQFQSGGAQLKDGTLQLKEGMDAYADEAISKLTGMIDPDSDLGQVLSAMLDRGADYENAGKAENMDYTVKFIMRTAAPGAGEAEPADAGEEPAPAAQAEESFWDRVKGLLQ